jgi:hypothetical protein
MVVGHWFKWSSEVVVVMSELVSVVMFGFVSSNMRIAALFDLKTHRVPS